MKVYAVFDTNVIVSAMITSHSDSPTVKVVEKVATGQITPLFNGEIIAEYDEVHIVLSLTSAKWILPTCWSCL